MSQAPRQLGSLPPISSAQEALALRGALALELINTETLDRGKKHERLFSPEALAAWWAETCKRYPDQCVVANTGASITWTSDLLEAIKVLRRALRTLATQVIEHQAVEEEELHPVNAILARGQVALTRTEQGTLKVVMQVRDPEQESILVPIACSALQFFTEADWQRLHQCKHDRCIVFFYDTTRSGTRRWCSPECMNRARSIAHYRLTKQKAAQE